MAKFLDFLKEVRTTILHVSSKEEFIQQFNQSVPPKEFFDSCEKALRLFRFD